MKIYESRHFDRAGILKYLIVNKMFCLGPDKRYDQLDAILFRGDVDITNRRVYKAAKLILKYTPATYSGVTVEDLMQDIMGFCTISFRVVGDDT